MKKLKLKNVINLTFASLMLILSGVFASQLFINKGIEKVEAAYRTPYETNVDFQVGKVNVTASDFVNGNFVYETNRELINTGVTEQLLDGKAYMLNNAQAEHNLSLSPGEENVENIYIAFGNSYNYIMGATNYGDRGVLLVQNLNVQAYLNGVNIEVPNSIKETGSTLNGTNINEFYHWYYYLDLNNIVNNITKDPITNTDGLYTFSFTYHYAAKSGNAYNTIVGNEYSISFYVVNQKTYFNNYPQFNSSATKGQPASDSQVQYYYNFLNATLPAIENYDASKYNISYIKRENQSIVDTITSTFVVNGDNSGTVTFRNASNSVVYTQTVSINAGRYLVTLPFENLGTYEILIRYVVKTHNGYETINRDQITAYNFNEVLASDNPYETNYYLKSYYKLHVFGVKAFYTKNNTRTHFKDGLVSADYSSKVSGLTSVNHGYYIASNGGSPDGLYPTTNLPPITFDSYGTYSYIGSVPQSKIYRYTTAFTGTPAGTSYVTKNTEISNSGYYEVVFEYTFDSYTTDNGSGSNASKHYQVFVFRINNSTLPITLMTSDDLNYGSDTPLGTNTYTKNNVYATWQTPTVFMAPVTARIITKDYNDTNTVNTVATLNTLGNNTRTEFMTQNKKYMLRVFYAESQNLYVEFSFVIDKTAIQNIQIQALNASYSGSVPTYFINSSVNLNASPIINQPFTLSYSQKASGASITTTYQKVPFIAYNGGNFVGVGENYITNNYQIDYYSSTSPLEYILNYNQISQGRVDSSNAFIDTSSFIYLFTITDSAGNVDYKFVIYDLTLPEVIVDPEIDNALNIISNPTFVKWGSHKAVFIKNAIGEISSMYPTFRKFVTETPNFFSLVDGNYYMLVPITSVRFIYNLNGMQSNVYSFTPSASANKSVQLLPITPGSPTPLQQFFSGNKKLFTYYVTDASKITSSSDERIRSKNQTYTNTIHINLDNSKTTAYDRNLNVSSNNPYGNVLYEHTATNSHQLRISYIPGEVDGDYEVISMSYNYYDLAPSNFYNIVSGSNTTFSFEASEPRPSYPYNSTPTIARREIVPSSTQIVDPISGDVSILSEVINASNQNGQITTSAGMYVFRREYKEKVGVDRTHDPVIEYYVYYVDRENIINISGDANDNIDIKDITITSESDKDSILYNTGSGIVFRFTNSPSDTTRYSAKRIQQYLSQTLSTNLFSSNKLPVTLTLPGDKYNTKQVLTKATDSASQSSYITTATSKMQPFGLYYKISYQLYDAGNLSSSYITIADTLQYALNGVHFTTNSDFITTVYNSATNTYSLSFKKAHTYKVELFTNIRGAEETRTVLSFEFSILHESPMGKYFSEYNDGSVMEIETLSTTTSTINFKSTNKEILTFVFADNQDPYKALIDSNNLTVRRTGTATALYSRVNGNAFINGVATIPANDTVFSFVEAPGTGLRTYTLNLGAFITNPTHYNNATYTVTLQFIGDEESYKIDPTDTNTHYFRRNFVIVIDREKPTYNLNQLQSLDSQKYNASAVAGLNQTNYFYAINSSFNFKRVTALGGDRETKEIFVRPVNYLSDNYLYTITPDNPIYYTSELNNHPRFPEGNPQAFYANSSIYSLDSATNEYIINAGSLLGHLTSGTGYYEIIERDEAGNYQVYVVQYTNTTLDYTYSFSYIQEGFVPGEGQTEEDGRQPRTLPYTDTSNPSNPTTVRTITLNGNKLQFSSINTNDYFLSAKIVYSGNTVYVRNNPNTNPSKTSTTEFITQLNNALAFTNVVSQNGYSVVITLVNRFGENFIINYNVAGDLLQLVFTQLSPTRFRVTIPNDTVNGSTKIEEFRVWRFRNGAFDEELGQDINNKTISKTADTSTGPSLGGQTYEFGVVNGVGEYQFKLVDNFGRGYGTTQPYAYYGLGVNDVRTMDFGTNQLVSGVYYTAGPAKLTYQKNLYTLKVYRATQNVLGEIEYLQVTNLNIDGISTRFFSDITVEEVTFNLVGSTQTMGYRVELEFKRIATTYTYNFMLYRVLPEIELTNLSGGKITTSKNSTSPTVHTEEFKVVWENSIFNERVNLTRTYYNSNGISTTVSINNITNGYVVRDIGKYVATITNNLGYTDTTKTIYFELVYGSVLVYDVVTINGNRETIVSPSSRITSKNIGGSNKVLYQYYVLEQFNGSIAGNDIQIRVNRDRGIDFELLGAEHNQNHPNSKLYRIFGTTNYGYERFIEIVFVSAQPVNSNFVDLVIAYPTYNEQGEFLTDSQYNISNASVITITTPYINLSWKSNNEVVAPNPSIVYYGNTILADYYYNNVFVRTIQNFNISTLNTLKLTQAGIYKFSFYDTAGNKQTFNNSAQLTINLINNVLFKVNDDEPINYFITNDPVSLQLINTSQLYSTTPVVSATLNGNAISKITDYYENGVYTFSTHGNYQITITARVRNTTVDIVTKYNFIIINKNQSVLSLNVPNTYKFNVVNVNYKNSNITNTLPSLNDLWLSQGSTGSGRYVVTLSTVMPATGFVKQFGFELWINEQEPYIVSDPAFGESTTGKVSIQFNPYTIYERVGAVIIRITGMEDIIINEETSVNELQTINLLQNRIYWVQVFTEDGQLISSYKITKNEPLNPTAIFIIVLVSLIVVSLTVVFIVLRRHVKFR